MWEISRIFMCLFLMNETPDSDILGDSNVERTGGSSRGVKITLGNLLDMCEIETSRLEDLATLRLAKFASEARLRFTIQLKVCPDTLRLANSVSFNTEASNETCTMSCKFPILLRESLYQRSTTIQAQRNLIERPLRVVVGTLQ